MNACQGFSVSFVKKEAGPPPASFTGQQVQRRILNDPILRRDDVELIMKLGEASIQPDMLVCLLGRTRSDSRIGGSGLCGRGRRQDLRTTLRPLSRRRSCQYERWMVIRPAALTPGRARQVCGVRDDRKR